MNFSLFCESFSVDHVQRKVLGTRAYLMYKNSWESLIWRKLRTLLLHLIYKLHFYDLNTSSFLCCGIFTCGKLTWTFYFIWEHSLSPTSHPICLLLIDKICCHSVAIQRVNEQTTITLCGGLFNIHDAHKDTIKCVKRISYTFMSV